jgi:DNA polymerase
MDRKDVRAYLENLKLYEDELHLPPRKSPRPITARSLNILSGSMSPLPESLEIFEKAICRCTKCSLGATRTKFVFGVGNPQARIVFVGEAPGADEDLKGVPFVGRAGKLLDEMLAKIGLDRTQVYICNTLKCRPPGNRSPLPEEKATCRPYLRTQLSLISPDVIVCLGRHAAMELLGTEEPMKNLRGHLIPWEGMQVMVTYHPAYFLRNMTQLPLGEEDFRHPRRIYDALPAQ